MEFVRLFIAVRLPEPVLDSLVDLQSALAMPVGGDAVRWVNRETMHVTLHFLGETPRDRLSAAVVAVEHAAPEWKTATRPSPIDLGADGVGAFPSASRARVVWAGVRDVTGALGRLHRAIGRGLADAGFQTDHRQFRPHVTLGYVRRRATQAARTALASALVDARRAPPEWTTVFSVTEVSLVRSTLTPAGPVYRDLYSAVL